MQIHAIKEDEHSPFTQDAFAKELRTISDQFGVRLVSVGAMATVDDGKTGTMYLAVWSVESDGDQGD